MIKTGNSNYNVNGQLKISMSTAHCNSSIQTPCILPKTMQRNLNTPVKNLAVHLVDICTCFTHPSKAHLSDWDCSAQLLFVFKCRVPIFLLTYLRIYMQSCRFLIASSHIHIKPLEQQNYCCLFEDVEQPTVLITTGRQLQTIQTATEHISVCY